MLRDKALFTYAILNGYKFNMGDVIECPILESKNSKAILHPSLITKICLMAGVDISESEEKCPPMTTLLLPKEKQGSSPSRPTVSHSVDDSRDDGEGEVVSEDSNSEEEEEEPTHEGIEHIRNMASDMAKVQFEEYTNYRRRNAKLHLDISKVMDR